MLTLISVLIGLAVLIITAALIYRKFCQYQLRTRTLITAPNGIESLEPVELNGSRQWIYIRGQDQSNPVLLFLHGGPGSTELPVARHFGLELEKHFTVVHWDQRASGKSRHSDRTLDELTVDVYLQDGLSLTRLLRQRFRQDKIVLVGHSWGSLLGVLLIRDYPELFCAYAGLGQSVEISRAEAYSHDWVRQRAAAKKNQTALKQLGRIKPPYDTELSGLFIHRKWLNRYGGSIGRDIRGVIRMYLTSPEYSLLDVLDLQPSANRLLPQLWPQITRMNLVEAAHTLQVPVFFLMGRNDHHTPGFLVQEYFDTLTAPQKKIVWFENSGHAPNFAEPEKFQRVMIEEVLPHTV